MNMPCPLSPVNTFGAAPDAGDPHGHARWAAAGFRDAIIPIEPGSKRCTLSGWTDHATTDADIAAWGRAGHGVGIRGRWFPAVDIDVTDATVSHRLMAAALAHVGMNPVRIGKAPKTLIPCRLTPGAAPFPKLALPFTLPDGSCHKIEILGDGQQWVADAIHPDTGQPYSWPYGSAADRRADQLATLDGDAARDLLDYMKTVLETEFGATVGAGTGSATGGGEAVPAASEADAIRMLWRIPNDGTDGPVSRDEWVALAHAFKGALPPGSDMVAAETTWEQWSEQYPGSIPGEAARVFASARPDKAGYPQLERAAMKYGGWSPFTPMALKTTAPSPLRWRNVASEAVKPPPPPRDWVWGDRIAAGTLTILTGEGSIGKSWLALEIGAHIAASADFAGRPCKGGGVLGVFSEDDAHEIIRRSRKNASRLNLPESRCAGFDWLCSDDGDLTIATFDRDANANPTEAFKAIRARALNERPRLIIVDNVSTVMLGNENDGQQVAAFCRMLNQLARDTGAAVLLLMHPAKAEGSVYAGSKNWRSHCRTMWFMRAPVEGEPGYGDPSRRILECVKNNLGPEGERIWFTRDHGVFVPDPVASTGVSQNPVYRAYQHQHAVLCGLADLKQQGGYASPVRQAGERYYARALRETVPVVTLGMGEADIRKAVAALRASGHVREETVQTSHRNTARAFVPTEKALAAPPLQNSNTDNADLPKN